MFNDNERFGPAFAWAGDPREGPHEHHHGGGRRFGPGREFGPGFGPGRGFGPGFFGPGPDIGAYFHFLRGVFGPGGRRGPNMYGRGDLKFVLLDLLQEKPKHGYEMIKELEGRAGGFYTPSAGAVYPTLQLLEDRGWVTSATDEGKKVYTITDAGRAALAERQAQPQPEQPGPGPHGGPGPHAHGPDHEHEHGPHGPGREHGPGGRPWGRHTSPFGGFFTPELESLGRDSLEVVRLMRDAVIAARGDPAKIAKIRSIVEQTRQALSALAQQGESQPPPQGSAPPPEMV
jgi:DNA-binding PadR family transcriptional regulator